MAFHPESFAGLLAPLPLDEFLDRYWETTFFHGKKDGDGFGRFFSLEDFDSWLATTRGLLYLTPPPQGGDTPRTETLNPRAISASTVYAAFARGCLLVLGTMNDWPAIHLLTSALGKDLHADVLAEVFVAPVGVPMFEPHVAGHDLLILQISGERRWNLHEFELLQRNPLEKKNLNFPLEWYGRTRTPVQAEVLLAPGHLLYVPRGMPYQARPTTTTSLHLQLQINPLSWADLFKIALDCASLHSQDLRRSLPPGFLEQNELAERMRGIYHDLLRQLPELASFDEVLAATKRNRVKHQDFPADGHFPQLLELDRLTAETLVERRPHVLCFAEKVTDVFKEPRAALFFGQELVAGPRHLLRAAEFVRDHPRFRVDELPGLDAAGQLSLVRRLILEGLLRQVAAHEVVPAAQVP